MLSVGIWGSYFLLEKFVAHESLNEKLKQGRGACSLLSVNALLATSVTKDAMAASIQPPKDDRTRVQKEGMSFSFLLFFVSLLQFNT